MPAASITLDEALDLARTGDVWLFLRGGLMADRAIQVATNSPVNHVGMTVAIEDLPPLIWHAELGRSSPTCGLGPGSAGSSCMICARPSLIWTHRYGQRAWLRQLDPPATPEMEDALLRTIARLDGTPFPSTTRLASRWLLGRAPAIRHQAPRHRPGDRLLRGSAWPSLTRPWACWPAHGTRTGMTAKPASGQW